jgi:hypothetical protein
MNKKKCDICNEINDEDNGGLNENNLWICDECYANKNLKTLISNKLVNKKQSCTVGELMDFLLSQKFSREDKIIVENTQGNEKLVWDIGWSDCSSEDTNKLLISMRKN